jgi:tripartite-type tricarboxylate transporter receptor subunit TctC
VPTLDELGFGKEKVASWFALAGPAGMPAPLVARVRDIFIQASKDPELQRRLARMARRSSAARPRKWGEPWRRNGTPCRCWPKP